MRNIYIRKLEFHLTQLPSPVCTAQCPAVTAWDLSVRSVPAEELDCLCNLCSQSHVTMKTANTPCYVSVGRCLNRLSKDDVM